MLEPIDRDCIQESYTFRGMTCKLDEWTASLLNYALALNGLPDRYVLSKV